MEDMRLLLVDDEERFVQTMATLMAKKGVETHTAANGLDAMDILEAHKIDVVVLDVKMPGVDGIEVLRRIKERYPLVEVIILTGHSSCDMAIDGLKKGAYDFLNKPVEVEVILEKARTAWAKKRTTEEKIQKLKMDRIVSHPLEVFEED